MATREDTLREQVDACLRILANDPGPLEPGDKRCVLNLHGTGAEDMVLTLKAACERVEGSAMFYFTGQRGAGKSTELRRLKALLASRHSKAFLVDASDYVSETHPLKAADLLLIVAAAFADALRVETGQDLLSETWATRFFQWLQNEVEIKEIAVRGVKLALKNQHASVFERIRNFEPSKHEAFMDECRAFITDMAGFARKQFARDRIVLIVDSLERMRDSGLNSTAMFDHMVDVFDGNMEKLKVPELQLVFSVPPYLPYLADVASRVRTFSLASVRVLEPPSGDKQRVPRTSGLGVMRNVLEQRYPQWQALLQPAALNRIALASGGDLRQYLIRLLTEILEQAYYAPDRLPLAENDEIVSTVIARQQGHMRKLVAGDEYPLLKAISESHLAELPERDKLPLIARFFDTHVVLNYRNGEDWVDVNPLLWPAIDAWKPPGNAGA